VDRAGTFFFLKIARLCESGGRVAGQISENDGCTHREGKVGFVVIVWDRRCICRRSTVRYRSHSVFYLFYVLLQATVIEVSFGGCGIKVVQPYEAEIIYKLLMTGVSQDVNAEHFGISK
jgi:hypothetical protein